MQSDKDWRAKTHHMVNTLFDDIEAFKTKGSEVAEEQQARFNERIAALNKQKADLESQYKKLSASASAAKEEARKGFDAATDELADSWHKVKAEFKL